MILTDRLYILKELLIPQRVQNSCHAYSPISSFIHASIGVKMQNRPSISTIHIKNCTICEHIQLEKTSLAIPTAFVKSSLNAKNFSKCELIIFHHKNASSAHSPTFMEPIFSFHHY